jgi:hypothetical protein
MTLAVEGEPDQASDYYLKKENTELAIPIPRPLHDIISVEMNSSVIAVFVSSTSLDRFSMQTS